MQKNSQLEIPAGWRRLQEGEFRQEGDMFFLNGNWLVSSLVGHEITKHDPTMIRCVENDLKKNKKKTKTFNQFSLLPSCFSPQKSCADIVKAYLKRIEKKGKK